MLNKVKDFYAEHKDIIKDVGKMIVIVSGVATGVAVVSYGIGYNQGEATGKNVAELAINVLYSEALKKDPNIKLEDFCNQEYIDNLANEIMGRVE